MDSLGFSKILTCRNFRELAGLVGQYGSRVGLAVIQFDLPGMKRTKGLRRLCETWPAVPILITADRCDRDTTLEVLGRKPWLHREEQLTAGTGTRDAGNSRGQVFVPPMPAGRSDAEPAQAGINHPAVLTARQKEVLNLLAAGKSNKQIAWALGISEGTVKVHVNAAFRALGVHNRVNATTALLGLSDLASVGS